MKPKYVLLYLLVASAVVSTYMAIKKFDRQTSCRKACNEKRALQDEGGSVDMYLNPLNRMISSTIK